MKRLPGRRSVPARLPLAAILAAGLAGLLLVFPWAQAKAEGVSRPGRSHQVYFADTPNELNIYRVYGAKDGKTLMLIGGIQGDEPGGFLSADLYTDISLAEGNLIVVPRANFYSIILNHRGPDGDMNRQFGDPVTARRHEKIVTILKELMAESDLLLNLHDGSGFFRPTWENSMANPNKYGQSLIADTDAYKCSDGRVIDLKSMAERVLKQVNLRIEDPRHHLQFNNHRTAEKDSSHKEQRLSATYYALTRCNIPAFGVETSKSLPSVDMKVRHHNLAINAFMEELGIVPESPGSYMENPRMSYLVVSVNDHLPVVATDGSLMKVSPGDRVKVTHIEANYNRGLTCDFLNMGSVSDLRQPFTITGPTVIVARKDNQEIGRVQLDTEAGASPYTTVSSKVLYFLVETEDGQRRMVADGESVRVVKGDNLTLVEVISNLHDQVGIQVNLKGFVPPGRGNEGEDRGHLVNTAMDLLPRYSSCPDGKTPDGVECYRVEAAQNRRSIGDMWLEVVPARLDYLVVRQGQQGPKMVYHNGETIRTPGDQTLEVVDMKSNVTPAQQLELVLQSSRRRLKLEGPTIDPTDQSVRKLVEKGDGELKLMVMRQERPIGHVRLRIGGTSK